MAEKYIMIHDIMSEHKDRMLNLKKYYPFFVLCETTFSQYKEGKYMELDMGYITMATLRFFINENNFHESEITYDQYVSMVFRIVFSPEKVLEFGEGRDKGFAITDMHFEVVA